MDLHANIILLNGNLYRNLTKSPETNWFYQHLYFVSAQKPKMGDWFCNPVGGYVDKMSHHTYGVEHGMMTLPHCRKIIASTDSLLDLPKPTNRLIKKYCKQNGIKEVLVEYELIETIDHQGRLKRKRQAKTSSENTIYTKLVKDIWTRGEVIKLCTEAYHAGQESGCGTSAEEWIERNINI